MANSIARLDGQDGLVTALLAGPAASGTHTFDSCRAAHAPFLYCMYLVLSALTTAEPATKAPTRGSGSCFVKPFQPAASNILSGAAGNGGEVLYPAQSVVATTTGTDA
eukprot:CAMPEP_0119312224 /NCGR_PEP_ID=MMETSP1333-20130426/25530_1 /TAXON_ID=418940 /ORGANISM="Scyphosphaera apsteinii, Strain RCC1455" /LENGTH=107 /DNA_ID=CAMNT_0007316813 /DNA_START=332 /DNA_END=655 /DNA_ORIENTATION=-